MRADAAHHRQRELTLARERASVAAEIAPPPLKTLSGETHTRSLPGNAPGNGTPSPPSPQPLAQEPHPQETVAAAAIPQFPWPPPPPSAQKIIPGGVLLARIREVESHTKRVMAVAGRYHLRDVDAVLRRSLRANGYEYRYYGAPQGFVMVARLERITDSGSPFPAQQRFDASFQSLQQFSLVGYLRALFLAPPGHYRVIALVLSPEPFRATGRPVSAEDAEAWLEGGVNVLPRQIGELEYKPPDYACTALIYEFEKRDTQTNPVELHPGRLSADTHLAASGIADLLWKRLYP